MDIVCSLDMILSTETEIVSTNSVNTKEVVSTNLVTTKETEEHGPKLNDETSNSGKRKHLILAVKRINNFLKPKNKTLQEEFGIPKGVIRSRISKNRQCHSQK